MTDLNKNSETEDKLEENELDKNKKKAGSFVEETTGVSGKDTLEESGVIVDKTKDPKNEELSADEKQEKQKSKKEKGTSSNKKRFPFILVVNLLLMLVIAAAIVWIFVKVEENKSLTEKGLNQVNQTISAQYQQIIGLKAKQNTDNKTLVGIDSDIKKRINGLEQIQKAQNKRLLSISTTSREDWLLAEAEYLLKLANQRVLIEKNATGADALLVEADQILLGLEDPDLFPLRQAIANDLAALRLTKKIDIEGLYLGLSALANAIEYLPSKPSRKDIGAEKVSDTRTLENNSDAEKNGGVFDVMLESFATFMNKLREYIRVTNHTENPTPILVPELNQYARLNLRLLIEKSQLALLREQQVIYDQSIQQAIEWTNTYFPKSQETQTFIGELALLEERQVVTKLPDISGSLELIHSYIEQLHNLKGISVEVKK